MAFVETTMFDVVFVLVSLYTLVEQ